MTIPVDPMPFRDISDLAGSFLVATPKLTEPIFNRTVILLLEHNDEGALGVITNRESPLPVSEVLAQWDGFVSDPKVLFAGGPVAQDSVLAVTRLRLGVPPPLTGWRRCFGQVGLIDLDMPPQIADGSIDAMRLFAGYAGWGDGQLESEIAEGSWFVVRPRSDDLFTPDTDNQWRSVLRRQSAPIAYASTHPEDPELN